MITKKFTFVLFVILFFMSVLPSDSAGRGRLKITEVSPAQQIILNESNPETTLIFSVSGMIITPGTLAMIAMAGGIPVEVELVPANPSLDLSQVTVEPSGGLITFDRRGREFGVFETTFKLTNQSNQRIVRNLVTQGAFSCERQDGTLKPEGNVGNVGQNIVILCMGTGLTGETMIELGGSTGDTNIATVSPGFMSVDVNPDGSVTNIDFIVHASMEGQTDVALDFIGSMTFEVLGTFWNFQQGNAGGNMGGGSSTSSSSGDTGATSMTEFFILVDDEINPRNAIREYRRPCTLTTSVQGTTVTCP